MKAVARRGNEPEIDIALLGRKWPEILDDVEGWPHVGVQDGEHRFRLCGDIPRAIAEPQKKQIEHADRDCHTFKILKLRLAGPLKKVFHLVDQRLEPFVGAGVQGGNDQNNSLGLGKPLVEFLCLLGVRVCLSGNIAAWKGSLSRRIANMNGELSVFEGADRLQPVCGRLIKFEIKPYIGNALGRFRQIPIVTSK